MKKFFFCAVFLLMLSAANDVSAQSSVDHSRYHCIYKYTRSCEEAGQSQPHDLYLMLQVGYNVTSCMDYALYQLDSVNHAPTSTNEEKEQKWRAYLQNADFFDPVVQRPIGGDMTVYDQLAVEQYRYNEPLSALMWEMGEATDSIAGYLCQEAFCDYGGHRWRVMFAPEIAVDAGPWKLCGLPGMVMRAEAADKSHVFELISLQQSSAGIYQPETKSTIATARDEFVKNKNIYEQNPDAFMSQLSMEAIREVTVIEGQMLINGVHFRKSPFRCAALER
ncbi:GLPGLI family protein [Porphyromonas loveana]|uniref:GLPGLI family protein n=1 Tax=Porphyromonas loveana TaxID=1884669 RepID=UPI0035A11E67